MSNNESQELENSGRRSMLMGMGAAAVALAPSTAAWIKASAVLRIVW
jgi:hypothetical protein